MVSRDDVPILVAEDSDEDFEMLRWALTEAEVVNPLVRAKSGESVIATMNDMADSDDGLPGLVFLDLNLIGLDGRAVLRHLKTDARLRKVPVLVFSTSDNPRDVETCYQEGANAYSLKPLDLDRFVAFARQVKAYWLEHTVLPRRSVRETWRGKSV